MPVVRLHLSWTMTETHYIFIIVLTAAVVAVPLFQRPGPGAVLGFLVAGVRSVHGESFIMWQMKYATWLNSASFSCCFIIGIEENRPASGSCKNRIRSGFSEQAVAPAWYWRWPLFDLTLRSAHWWSASTGAVVHCFWLADTSDKGRALGTEYGRASLPFCC